MSRALRGVGSTLALLIAVGGAGCSKKKELSVTGWDPKVGPYVGGGVVTIQGTGFQEGGARGVKVYFGDKEAKVEGWVGDDKLRVVAPPGEIGQEVSILMVFDDAKDLTIEKAYKYEDIAKDFSVDALTEGKSKETEAPLPPPGGGATPPPPGGTAPPPAGGTAPPPPGGTTPPPAGGTAPATPPAGGDAPK